MISDLVLLPSRAIELIDLGGPVVALLIGISVLVLALILVKLWQFHRLRIGRHGSARAVLRRWLETRDRRVLADIADDPNPSARVLAGAVSGLIRAGSNPSAAQLQVVREDIERLASSLLAEMRQNLRGLDAAAQLAPLLGLFGTVLGMIAAFQELQGAAGQVDPSDLAGGIWVALLTTAIGLMIAMPASLVLTWFESRISREQLAMEDVATSVLTGRITDVSVGASEPDLVVAEA